MNPRTLLAPLAGAAHTASRRPVGSRVELGAPKRSGRLRPLPAAPAQAGPRSVEGVEGRESESASEAGAGARLGGLLAAWAVHAVTMSGLVWAALALLALAEGRIASMWLWLGVALVVDGVDGTLARRARVKERVPWFDGSILDVIVDYLTWTFIPAVFMFSRIPFDSRGLAIAMMLLVLVSSVFCYANEGEKSADSYFVGFPAAWNLVAASMYVLATPAPVNIAIVIVLAVLTLVPLHYAHPMRVKRLRGVNIAAALVWIGATGVLIDVHPARPTWALLAFAVSGVLFLSAGLARTVRARSDEDEPARLFGGGSAARPQRRAGKPLRGHNLVSSRETSRSRR